MFVKNLVNAETKNHILQNTIPAATANTWTYQNLNGIPQGDTSSSRDGDSVKNKSITIRGTIDMNDAVISQIQHIRLVLFKMRNAQTSPNSSELWQLPADYNTPRNANFIKHYKIIHEKKITIARNNNATSKSINWSFPLKSHTEYATVSSVIATNAYYLGIFTTAESTLYPTIKYVSKLTFLDN